LGKGREGEELDTVGSNIFSLSPDIETAAVGEVKCLLFSMLI
jgi:hypothetical protein